MVQYETDLNTFLYMYYLKYVFFSFVYNVNFVMWWVDLPSHFFSKEMGRVSVNNAYIIPTLVFKSS